MEYTMERVLVKELDDPADFLEAAGPVLLADEARHNLILGIAGTLRDLPPRYPTFQLWVVTDERVPVAAALRTPPFNLVLAGQVEGVTPLADALAHDDAELPGATGAVPEVEAFAARFEAGTGVRARERDAAAHLPARAAPARVERLRHGTHCDRGGPGPARPVGARVRGGARTSPERRRATPSARSSSGSKAEASPGS